MSDLRVVVAIPTYRRPDRLRTLLDVLPERIADAIDSAHVEVLVVDNDPNESARSVLQNLGFPFRYVVEITPGIAAARNRAIHESFDADLLAFIDDDERPLPGWLPALLDTWRDSRPSAVMGRVVSVFEAEADPWILATGVFERRPRPTGSPVAVAAAGNLLLDLAQVRSTKVSFDETLGLSGGEDTLFSLQLRANGGRITWCNESVAEDFVPAERMTRSWAMKRAFNGGNTAIVVDLRLQSHSTSRLIVRARGVLGGCARMAAGYVTHLRGRITGDVTADARGLRTANRGRGMAAASLGHQHLEYARPN